MLFAVRVINIFKIFGISFLRGITCTIYFDGAVRLCGFCFLSSRLPWRWIRHVGYCVRSFFAYAMGSRCVPEDDLT